VCDPRQVGALYGLEPVFEPGEANAGRLAEFVTINCPYCGESFDTRVDLSGGPFSYVEDCQVCCQPIEIGCEVDDDGGLVDVRAARLD
jgi:Cysteine-rich CPXCG